MELTIEQKREAIKKALMQNQTAQPSIEQKRETVKKMLAQQSTIDQTKGMSEPEIKAFDIASKVDRGEISPLRGDIRATGLGIDTIVDSAVTPVVEAVAEMIPEPAKEFLSETGKTFMNTPVGDVAKFAIEKGGDVLDGFKASYPELSKDIDAAVSIGGTLAPGAVIGRRQVLNKWDFLEDVVKPYDNKKNRKAALKDMRVQGVMQKKVFPASNEQKQMMNALKTVPGIKSTNINSKNYYLVNKHISDSAEKLKTNLAKLDVPVRKKEIENTLRRAAANVNQAYTKSKRMGADEITTYIDDIQDLIGDVNSPAELLDARKKIDAQFRLFSGDRRASGALIPTKDEIKWRSARDSLNALLEMKAPGTRSELRRQHNLYKTLDVLEDKAEWEKDTIFGRVKEKLPFMGDSTTTLIPKKTK